ncbi:pyridoxal-phosphate dependent enzyme [Propionibacterium acidifaciens]|uniref:pyridoxal-phosphate dependent enzyme n=1 Tax=Propionibacterium acidifaciens TaxID=556499 RepID=UPI0023F2D72D|nr:pyridoxal-phosphate dependent enzyme [Propionibacterium acidifaciens]
MNKIISLDEAEQRIETLCDLKIIRIHHPQGEVRAIFGSPTTESSFKSILGIGLLLLARRTGKLSSGQPVIESTSGSLGVGLAAAGMLLGHPVHLVSDINIPQITLQKIKYLGATMHLVSKPHPTLGMQQSREDQLHALLADNEEFYWPKQNDSDLNPEVYRRWLVPKIELQLKSMNRVDAGCFVVGSGGHFTAFAEMLNRYSIPSYVADRQGSVTFGGKPGFSILRGTGNQNTVPEVISRAMHLVRGVHVYTDEEAVEHCQRLAREGIFVGGSSGVAYAGSLDVMREVGNNAVVLTFFPDRGELYQDLI